MAITLAVQKGSYIYVYDKKGKQISSTYAR